MNREIEGLKKIFPNISESNARPTSPRSNIYNCIAWAMEHTDRWLEPGSPDKPAKSIQGLTYPFESLIAVFEKLGYAACSDSSLESGFEKIAIFGNEGEWTHAARQLRTGQWSSKLGKSIDIEHTLDALESVVYGKVRILMKRQL